MPRSTAMAMLACWTLLLAGWVQADTVITMPLPPSHGEVPPATGISTVSVSLVSLFHAAGSTPDANQASDLARNGIDALERYVARTGRTRNHYMITGYVPAGGFRTGTRGQFYSSYEGPFGWGWWGSPIIVNNYCPNLQHSGCLGPIGSVGSFVGIGTY